MLKRIALVVLMMVAYDQAFAVGEAAAAHAVVQSQVQAQNTSSTTAAPTQAPTVSPETTQFTGTPYISLSLGPRLNFNGSPSLYEGIEATLAVGAGTLLTETLYLGGEVFLGDGFQLKNYPNPADISTGWSYGFVAMPGLLIAKKHVLAYFRLGGVCTRFPSATTMRGAWQVGFGAATVLCKNWALRGDYIYNGYKRPDNLGKPQTDQFSLGLVYRFL